MKLDEISNVRQITHALPQGFNFSKPLWSLKHGPGVGIIQKETFRKGLKEKEVSNGC